MELESERTSLSLPPPPKKRCHDIKCEQCNIEVSKYTCPKCGFRSCSVPCVKQHKEEFSCDGVSNAWKAVMKISNFTPEVSIGDQCFFDEVKDILSKKSSIQPTPIQQISIDQNVPADRLPRNELLLQKSAAFRRISIKMDGENDIKDSHYEGFSDTIFWTISLRFVRSDVPKISNGLSQLAAYDSPPSSPDKTTESFVDTTPIPSTISQLEDCFTFTARDIPESVTVRTLIRQFVQPKKFGPVVSHSDLNLKKMQPFLQSPNSCLVYMPTTTINGTIKYFGIDQSKSILENLRNRTINGHPEFIVALDTDQFNFEQPTQSDLQASRPVFHQHHNNSNSRKRNAPNNQRNAPNNQRNAPNNQRNAPNNQRNAPNSQRNAQNNHRNFNNQHRNNNPNRRY